MSHIPNAAIPDAAPTPEASEFEDGQTTTLAQRAGKLADLARDNPKTAAAAGAALFAGAVAAAAIPLVRGRRKAGGTASGGAAKSGSKKSGSKKKG